MFRALAPLDRGALPAQFTRRNIMHLKSIYRCLVLVAVLTSAGGAYAQPRVGQGSPSTLAVRCTQQPLRSAGYRDMLVRFPSRHIALDAEVASQLVPSYRDAVNRHAAAAGGRRGPGSGSAPRYVLGATVSCG